MLRRLAVNVSHVLLDGDWGNTVSVSRKGVPADRKVYVNPPIRNGILPIGWKIRMRMEPGITLHGNWLRS